MNDKNLKNDIEIIGKLKGPDIAVLKSDSKRIKAIINNEQITILPATPPARKVSILMRLLDKSHRSRPFFWLKIVLYWLFSSNNALYNNGIHYFDGNTGSGKTLLANIIINNLIKKNGFFYANCDEFFNENVFPLDVLKIFSDGRQKFRLENYIPEIGKNKGLVFDEINRVFNRRLNRTAVYNDIFIPLVNWCVRHRHDKIPRIYFIGQALELQDTQLQSIIRYKHLISSKKKYYYYFWKNELYLVRAPKKIKIVHMIKNKEKDIFKKFGKSKIKVNVSDLLSYNTYGFEEESKSLPTYQL